MKRPILSVGMCLIAVVIDSHGVAFPKEPMVIDPNLVIWDKSAKLKNCEDAAGTAALMASTSRPIDVYMLYRDTDMPPKLLEVLDGLSHRLSAGSRLPSAEQTWLTIYSACMLSK